MHAGKNQQKTEKTALNISLIGGTFFVALEVGMALYSSSQAVLLDAVYDGVELVMILISLVIIPFLYKPASEKRPFGYLQIESFFVVIKGFTMVAVTVGLIINNIGIMLQGGHHVSFSTIAYFELFVCIVSAIVVLTLKHYNRQLESPLVMLEIQEWKIDLIASLGMSAAFFLPMLITSDWFTIYRPYLDQIFAVILSVLMLPAPVKAVVTSLRDLFLIAPEEETVEHIKEIVTPILYAYDYNKLYFDIVRTGRKLWISVYITFDRDEVSISRFRIVQNFIIQALKKEYQDFYFELLPDIEFDGSSEVSQ